VRDDDYPFEVIAGGAGGVDPDAVLEASAVHPMAGEAAPAASSSSAPEAGEQAAPAPVSRELLRTTSCCASCGRGLPCGAPAGQLGGLMDHLADRPGLVALAGAALGWTLAKDGKERVHFALYGLVGGYVLGLALRRQP
jgi:hypothetical protein